MELIGIIKVFFLTALSFVTAMTLTPVLTHFLYKHKLGKQIRDSAAAPVMAQLHAAKSGTPTMGGILLWGTALILLIVFHYLARLSSTLAIFDFYSRPQTLLPMGALLAAAAVGLIDDYMNIRRIGPKGGGMRMRHRLILYTLIATLGALWFYFKLDWDVLRLPFLGAYHLGWLYVPFFILVIVATAFSVNEADGLDGLAGGLLLWSYAAYAAIAFVQGKMELAAFCGVIVGALIAFLWFNINPARFFMGDTGAMSLGVTLGIIAMYTNTAFLLPVIGSVFVAESLSVIIQIASKKLRGRKVFRSAPFHHHLEAVGWPEPKVVMRLWVIGGMSAVMGLVLALVDIAFY